MLQCLALLMVGAEKKMHPVIAMQNAIGSVLMAATGEDGGEIIPCTIKGIDDAEKSG